jgi:hypothetical protein
MLSNLHSFNIALILSVILSIVGCTIDYMLTSKQLSFSSALTQQKPYTVSYTDKYTNAVGSCDYNTVSFLTDGCGKATYSKVSGKAVGYGIAGGLFGASQGAFLGVASGTPVKG